MPTLSRNTTVQIPITRTMMGLACLVLVGVIALVMTAAHLFNRDGRAFGFVLPDPRPVKRCTDFFACDLMTELDKTEKFLQRYKFLSLQGATSSPGYSADPRPLTPESEVIRLNIDTQAHGYLNLYLLTGNPVYRGEAEDRLNAMLAMDQNLLNNGMVGYTFLVAAEKLGTPAYRQFGLRVADDCLPQTGIAPNWGYMCAMVMGKAYTLTHDQKYLNKLREVTHLTGTIQHDIGSFPHNLGDGPSLPYSGWLMEEALFIRQEDVSNPDLDIQLLKSKNFFRQRVNTDGSLSYEDAAGRYDYNAGLGNVRGWTSNIAPVANVLKSMGEIESAQQLLQFLFRQQMTGKNAGGYPDKYDNLEPDVLWATGRPSILRTSLIFWDLTTIALNHKTKTSCMNGAAPTCAITANNCHPAFAALGQCTSGLSGQQFCINGQQTLCLNPSLVRYETVQCGENFFQCGINRSCWHVCHQTGPRQCIGNSCGQCLGVVGEPVCQQQCDEKNIPEQCLSAQP